MSVYKPKGSPYYHFDFQMRGSRFFGTTKCSDRRQAEAVERSEREKAKAVSKSDRDLPHTYGDIRQRIEHVCFVPEADTSAFTFEFTPRASGFVRTHGSAHPASASFCRR